MVLGLTLAEVGSIAGIATGLVALVLSGLALYRQRLRPRLEASVVRDGPSGDYAVAVRNGGNASAKTPWFLVVIEGKTVLTHVGRGFLGAGEGRYVLTRLPFGPRR